MTPRRGPAWCATTPPSSERAMRAWLPERQVYGPERAGERDIDGLNRVFAEAFTDRYRRDGLVGVRVPQLNPDVWRYALLDAGAGPRRGTGPRGSARGRLRLHARDHAHGRAGAGRHVAGGRPGRARRHGAVALGPLGGRAPQGRGAHPQAGRTRRTGVRRRDRGGGSRGRARRDSPRGRALPDALHRRLPPPHHPRLPRALDRPADDPGRLSRAAPRPGRAVFQLGDLTTTGLVIFAATYVLIAVQRLPFVHLNRPAASLLGAVAMVALGVLPLVD